MNGIEAIKMMQEGVTVNTSVRKNDHLPTEWDRFFCIRKDASGKERMWTRLRDEEVWHECTDFELSGDDRYWGVIDLYPEGYTPKERWETEDYDVDGALWRAKHDRL